jgi:hypothetical protein
MGTVDCAEIVRDEYFHGLTRQFFARVAEDQLGLSVHDGNRAAHIHDDDGIRSYFQEALESHV